MNPRSSIARAAALLRLGGAGYARRFISSTSGVRLWCATKWRSWPSNRYTKQNWPSQSRRALSAIMSNTGWTSVVERLMTLSTSAVAICCSRASFSSRVSRATSVSGLVELRERTAFGASRRSGFVVLRRCDLADWPPALERRLIAFPEAQDKALQAVRLAHQKWQGCRFERVTQGLANVRFGSKADRSMSALPPKADMDQHG